MVFIRTINTLCYIIDSVVKINGSRVLNDNTVSLAQLSKASFPMSQVGILAGGKNADSM